MSWCSPCGGVSSRPFTTTSPYLKFWRIWNTWHDATKSHRKHSPAGRCLGRPPDVNRCTALFRAIPQRSRFITCAPESLTISAPRSLYIFLHSNAAISEIFAARCKKCASGELRKFLAPSKVKNLADRPCSEIGTSLAFPFPFDKKWTCAGDNNGNREHGE
jgi:hypothetical protein